MLTPTEIRTLLLLSKGCSTDYISQVLGVTKGRVHALYVYIRDKTGLKDLFDKKQVFAYLQSRKPKRMTRPTPTQLECLRLFSNDWSYEDIAQKLKLINPQTAQNHVSQACKRLGIVREQHEEYLATFAISWRGRRRELIENYLKGIDHKPQPLPNKSPYNYTGGHLNGDPCF